MGIQYQAVQWNRQKRLYDVVLGTGVALFLSLFAGVTFWLHPTITPEILLARATATAAFLLLHVILCLGPLCRLNRAFLPLLYNRRHAGVLMAVLAATHAAIIVVTYHAGSNVDPWLSVLISDWGAAGSRRVPFQLFGLFALVVVVLMAATSHDFWLANLTPPVWKALHQLVYLAYGAVVLHVVFGVLQAEGHPFLTGATALGLATVGTLHVVAGQREARADREARPEPVVPDGFVDVGAVDGIPDGRARIVLLGGERVAVFRHGEKIFAVSNVCQHQNGPLGEGRIREGCITCPWHGYQYDPETGASPPPFVERVPTFRVRVENGRIYVHPKPNPLHPTVPHGE